MQSRLLLNPNLSKPRNNDNFVSNTYVMFIEPINMVSRKQDVYGNAYWLNL